MVELASEHALAQGDIGGAVVGMRVRRPVHLHQFVVRVAQHLDVSPVHAQRRAPGGDVRHAGGAVLESGVHLPLVVLGQGHRRAQQPVAPLHQGDGTHHDQLGDEMPQVEPERLERVLEDQAEVGLDQQEIDEEHAHNGAEHADAKATVECAQRGGQRQGDEAPAGLGGRQRHAHPRGQRGDRQCHDGAQPPGVVGGLPGSHTRAQASRRQGR